MKMPVNLTELEDVAVSLAIEAAALIVTQRPRDLQLSAKSSVTDPVTAMDRRSENLIRRRLSTLRPHDGVYGEEHGELPGSIGSGGVTWVIDPIDGTVNYLYDIGHYAVSVGAVEGDPRIPGKWQPLAGAVANPVSGRVYHARRGSGAWQRRFQILPDGQVDVDSRDQAVRLAVTDTGNLATSLVATGFSYQSEVRRDQALALVDLLPRIRDIRRFGSAALDLCAVAAGLVDGYYEERLNPWDIAAGWLVVTEAGGRVSGWAGQALGDHRLVAGGPDVHRDLVFLLDGLLGED